MQIAQAHFVERDQLNVVIYRKKRKSSNEECAEFVVSKIKSAVELDHRNKSELERSDADASSSDDDENSSSSISTSSRRGAFVLTKDDISHRMKYLITVTHGGVVHGCMVVCVKEEEPRLIEEEEEEGRRWRSSRSGGFLFETEHEVFGHFSVSSAMITTLQNFVKDDTKPNMDGMVNLYMIQILIFNDARASATSGFLRAHGFERVSEACSDRYLCWLTFEWRAA